MKATCILEFVFSVHNKAKGSKLGFKIQLHFPFNTLHSSGSKFLSSKSMGMIYLTTYSATLGYIHGEDFGKLPAPIRSCILGSDV